MELWGKDDTFARWLNAVCAIPFLLFIGFDVYLLSDGIVSADLSCASIFSLYVCYRLLKYAVTGTGNVNRDDY